jgi:hypothetical protein
MQYQPSPQVGQDTSPQQFVQPPPIQQQQYQSSVPDGNQQQQQFGQATISFSIPTSFMFGQGPAAKPTSAFADHQQLLQNQQIPTTDFQQSNTGQQGVPSSAAGIQPSGYWGTAGQTHPQQQQQQVLPQQTGSVSGAQKPSSVSSPQQDEEVNPIIHAQPCPLVGSNDLLNPKYQGLCSWMLDPLVFDPDSRDHFLQCQPAPFNLLCGRWQRMPCSQNTVFDFKTQLCIWDLTGSNIFLYDTKTINAHQYIVYLNFSILDSREPGLLPPPPPPPEKPSSSTGMSSGAGASLPSIAATGWFFKRQNKNLILTVLFNTNSESAKTTRWWWSTT